MLDVPEARDLVAPDCDTDVLQPRTMHECKRLHPAAVLRQLRHAWALQRAPESPALHTPHPQRAVICGRHEVGRLLHQRRREDVRHVCVPVARGDLARVHDLLRPRVLEERKLTVPAGGDYVPRDGTTGTYDSCTVLAPDACVPAGLAGTPRGRRRASNDGNRHSTRWRPGLTGITYSLLRGCLMRIQSLLHCANGPRTNHPECGAQLRAPRKEVWNGGGSVECASTAHARLATQASAAWHRWWGSRKAGKRAPVTSREHGDSMSLRHAPLEKFHALIEPSSDPVNRRRWCPSNASAVIALPPCVCVNLQARRACMLIHLGSTGGDHCSLTGMQRMISRGRSGVQKFRFSILSCTRVRHVTQHIPQPVHNAPY